MFGFVGSKVGYVRAASLLGSAVVSCEEHRERPQTAIVGTHQYVANRQIEDRIAHSVFPSQIQFVAVLDGHSGFQVAEHMTRALPALMQQNLESGASMATAMRQTFLQADTDWFSLVKPAYDLGFTGPIKAGACAVAIAIGQDAIVVGSVGDCKCVLARSSHDGTITSVDLNPQRNANLESEQTRLRALHPTEDDVVKCKRSWKEAVVESSWVPWKTEPKFVTRHSGCYVKGRLQPTKSFGDFHLKRADVKVDPERNQPFLNQPKSYPYIDADPDVSVTGRRVGEDKFLIAATDGLWDQFSSHEAVHIVVERLKAGRTVDEAALDLVDAALVRAAEENKISLEEMRRLPPGSSRRNLHDDISVCIVLL